MRKKGDKARSPGGQHRPAQNKRAWKCPLCGANVIGPHCINCRTVRIKEQQRH